MVQITSAAICDSDLVIAGLILNRASFPPPPLNHDKLKENQMK
jgi:hypothetical protein